MRSLPNVIPVALRWALALIASSWLFRGLAIGDWVDAALYVGFGVWFGLSVACGPVDRTA